MLGHCSVAVCLSTPWSHSYSSEQVSQSNTQSGAYWVVLQQATRLSTALLSIASALRKFRKAVHRVVVIKVTTCMPWHVLCKSAAGAAVDTAAAAAVADLPHMAMLLRTPYRTLLAVAAAAAVFKHQMESCFFHTLTELDPQYSSHLASRPRTYKATMAEWVLKQLGITGEESEDIRLVRLINHATLSWGVCFISGYFHR